MCNEHEPKPAAQSRLMGANDFAQAAADTIPHDGATDPFRRHEPHAELLLILVRQNA
jgi:hypothetical protein